jgi:hypothetical protein
MEDPFNSKFQILAITLSKSLLQVLAMPTASAPPTPPHQQTTNKQTSCDPLLGTLGCCRRKFTYISWCARGEKKPDVTRRENEIEKHQIVFWQMGVRTSSSLTHFLKTKEERTSSHQEMRNNFHIQESKEPKKPKTKPTTQKS